MPKVGSALDRLPDDLKATIDAELHAKHFGSYDEIVAIINNICKKRSMDIRINRNHVMNRSRQIRQYVKRATYTKEMMRVLGDDRHLLIQEPILRLVEHANDLVTNLSSYDMTSRDLSNLARALKDLEGAMRARADWEADFKTRLARDLNYLVDDSNKKGSRLDMDTIRKIKKVCGLD